VRIDFTPTFTYSDAERVARDAAGELNRPLDAGDFWRAFRFRLAQPDFPRDGAAGDPSGPRFFEPREISAEPIYSRPSRGGTAALQGAVVSLAYEASRFGALPVRFEVRTPEGRRVAAAFPCETLR
jgi:hypothetical protein